jgi:hypothetical protein
MGKTGKAYMDWVKSTAVTRQAKRDAHKAGIKGLIKKPGRKSYMDWVKGAEKTRHVHRDVFKKGAKATAKAALRKEDRDDLIDAIIEGMLPVHPSSQKANKPGYVGPSGGRGGAMPKLPPVSKPK